MGVALINLRMVWAQKDYYGLWASFATPMLRVCERRLPPPRLA